MKNALLRLREACSSLSAAEQQIARYITENPEEATLLTVRELAARTFTSPSSVVRVCRSVGFEGYKELRRALVGELAALGDKGRHAEQELTPEDDVRDIVSKVTQKNIQSLSDSQKLLSAETVEACALLLDRCRSVILFGTVRRLTAGEEKRAAILALARRYSPDEPAEKVDAEIARYWDALCMLELTPDHITGKECIELVGR